MRQPEVVEITASTGRNRSCPVAVRRQHDAGDQAAMAVNQRAAT